jgi:tetratricopeptide (TPR) repeat protein
MKTIFADYNAMTEAGHVCLTTLGSQEDIQRDGLKPGDWAWLSDEEVIVGAQLATDSYYGLVGIPEWDTLVHLDDEGADDFDQIWREFEPMLQGEQESIQDQARFFQLCVLLERVAPPDLLAKDPSFLSMRRAALLQALGRIGLALREIIDARLAAPHKPSVNVIYLDLLRRQDLPAAVVAAESLARPSDVPAPVLTACSTVMATAAEEAPDDRFEPMARRVLELCDRLVQSTDFKNLAPAFRATLFLNRGLMLLRLGRIGEAQDAFRDAHETYPLDSTMDEATRLDAYDEHARELAHRVRDRLTSIAA